MKRFSPSSIARGEPVWVIRDGTGKAVEVVFDEALAHRRRGLMPFAGAEFSVTPATLAQSATARQSAAVSLLANVFSMSAQERDAEWEYQWRQLMQAIELELSASGYVPARKGADEHSTSTRSEIK